MNEVKKGSKRRTRLLRFGQPHNFNTIGKIGLKCFTQKLQRTTDSQMDGSDIGRDKRTVLWTREQKERKQKRVQMRALYGRTQFAASRTPLPIRKWFLAKAVPTYLHTYQGSKSLLQISVTRPASVSRLNVNKWCGKVESSLILKIVIVAVIEANQRSAVRILVNFVCRCIVKTETQTVSIRTFSSDKIRAFAEQHDNPKD